MSFSGTKLGPDDMGGRQFHRDYRPGNTADSGAEVQIHNPFHVKSKPLDTPRAPAPPLDNYEDDEVVYATNWPGSTLKITVE